MTTATALWRRVGIALATAGALGSCAALPPMPPRTETHALDPAAPTALAQRVAAERGPAGTSGVRLVAGGADAFATLQFLADSATRTLDLQYYAILNDSSSRVLFQRVRAAADRGVRVRLLLDDLSTADTDDGLIRLTRHPRIEVRLYNPLPGGRGLAITKVLSSLHDAARINSRMHNKVAVADNALAMTGGRNIGDHYFLQGGKANFVDLDVLVAGPVVQQLSRTFDRFWNSELAYPADAIIPPRAAEPRAPAASAASAPGAAASAPLDAPDTLPAAEGEAVARRLAELRAGPLGLQWSPARLLADAPSKSRKEGDVDPDETMFDDLGALLASARERVLIVTPYFVPGDKGMAMIRALRERGVRVRVLTAALAATDAPIVHVGYSRYRKPLLALGVELYELRPEATLPRQPAGGVHSRTNLHAKAFAIDGRTLLIGSMNLDPRSDRHNTEMGVLVRNPALAGELERLMDAVCRDGAYRITVNGDGALRWMAREADGSERALTDEPRVPAWKRWGLRLLAPLAPETML